MTRESRLSFYAGMGRANSRPWRPEAKIRKHRMGVGLSLPPTGDRACRCIETHQNKSWRDPMRVLHLSRPNQQGWIWTRHRLSATAQSSGTPLHRCARGCAYRVSIMARSRSGPARLSARLAVGPATPSADSKPIACRCAPPKRATRH